MQPMKSSDYTIWCLIAWLTLTGCNKTQNEPKVSKPSINSANPTKTPTPVPEPVRYHLYIPTDKGTLYQRVEENPKLLLTHEARNGLAYDWSWDAGTEAVRRVLKAAPDKFPPGTKLLTGMHDEAVPELLALSFNRAFAEPNWWRNDKRAKAALYAIINSAIKTKEGVWDSSDYKAVAFYVEGKRITRLGNFIIREYAKAGDLLIQTSH